MLRELRKCQRVTIRELSKRSGISRQAIYNYENGEKNPKMETIRKLALGLGVSVDEVLECFK